jgi:hypothetical protein
MRIQGIAAALAAGLAVAAPAAAVEDLTGNYEAKLSCKGIDNQVKVKGKVEVGLTLEDLGDGTVHFSLAGFPPGQGILHTEAAKPANGVLSAMSCNKDAENLLGVVLRVDVKTKAGQDDASLKGTAFLFDIPSARSEACKFTAKQVGTGPVKIGPCALP